MLWGLGVGLKNENLLYTNLVGTVQMFLKIDIFKTWFGKQYNIYK